MMMMLSTTTVIPSFLEKKRYLLHILVVMSLGNFTVEYISPKLIKIKLTINSVIPNYWLVNVLRKEFIYQSTGLLVF